MTKKTDIFITGVGGQGSLSASTALGEAAAKAGLKVLVGEIHGMAQRGGVVESTVRIGGACTAPSFRTGAPTSCWASNPSSPGGRCPKRRPGRW